MIKIIKKGNVPSTIKRFKCTRCGTVFEADKNDYKVADQMAYMEGYSYYCYCPLCGAMVTI